ncbi:MAG: hypothetical protein HW421_1582 [Ignavibacteria bacterium]|nr:hypothetical protein [Ignavibacteria bacterium]
MNYKYISLISIFFLITCSNPNKPVEQKNVNLDVYLTCTPPPFQFNFWGDVTMAYDTTTLLVTYINAGNLIVNGYEMKYDSNLPDTFKYSSGYGTYSGSTFDSSIIKKYSGVVNEWGLAGDSKRGINKLVTKLYVPKVLNFALVSDGYIKLTGERKIYLSIKKGLKLEWEKDQLFENGIILNFSKSEYNNNSQKFYNYHVKPDTGSISLDLQKFPFQAGDTLDFVAQRMFDKTLDTNKTRFHFYYYDILQVNFILTE